MSIRHFDLRQHGSCWKTGVFSFSSSSLRQLSALSPRLADLLDTALRNRFWSQLQTFNICPFCPNSLTFRDALTTLDRNRVMHLVNLVKTSFPLSPSRFFSYSWNLTPFTPLAASFRNRFKHSFSERTNGQFPFSCLNLCHQIPLPAIPLTPVKQPSVQQNPVPPVHLLNPVKTSFPSISSICGNRLSVRPSGPSNKPSKRTCKSHNNMGY